MKVNPFVVMNNEPDAKRKKTDYGQASAEKSKNETGKMIELEIFGSDEDIWVISMAAHFGLTIFQLTMWCCTSELEPFPTQCRRCI